MTDKERLDDLASLFLPDLLQQRKPEEYLAPMEVPELPEAPKPIYNYPDMNLNPYATFLPFDSLYMQHGHAHGPYGHMTSFAPYDYDNIKEMKEMKEVKEKEDRGFKEKEDTYQTPPKEIPRKKRRQVAEEVEIDYRPGRLQRLLDFKPVPGTRQHTVVDKDGNEVQVNFSGFLSGRFLTNDTENRNYLFSKSELPRDGCKADARVVSCYRRNYIHISLKVDVAGMHGRVLKVRSEEYGYTVSRVIKYLKIEVCARTNMSSSRSVPLFIKDVKDDERSRIKDPSESISPYNIGTSEHIFQLDDAVDGCVEQYFAIKKVQFKSATPNNGNLTFQNYYHLRVRLCAVVADMYYDDYVDIDAPQDRDGGNEVTLCELMSEPIIVRGRNPHFYNDRNDVLIKTRPVGVKSSFAEMREEVVSDVPVESPEEEVKESPVEVKTDSNYEYFPISSVYYLPPINVVYFPHGAHQSGGEKVAPVVRKGSNVYFK